MTRLRISTLFVTTLIVIAAKGIAVDAQATKQAVPSATSKSATLALSIAVPNEHDPLGAKTVGSLDREESGQRGDRLPTRASLR